MMTSGSRKSTSQRLTRVGRCLTTSYRLHFTSLAVFSWYLMFSPPHSWNAPLWQWHIYQSFDSAHACELAKTKAQNGHPGVEIWNAQRGVTGYAKMACIASDDPRLSPSLMHPAPANKMPSL